VALIHSRRTPIADLRTTGALPPRRGRQLTVRDVMTGNVDRRQGAALRQASSHVANRNVTGGEGCSG
jgi:hypothetical protein